MIYNSLICNPSIQTIYIFNLSWRLCDFSGPSVSRLVWKTCHCYYLIEKIPCNIRNSTCGVFATANLSVNLNKESFKSYTQLAHVTWQIQKIHVAKVSQIVWISRKVPDLPEIAIVEFRRLEFFRLTNWIKHRSNEISENSKSDIFSYIKCAYLRIWFFWSHDWYIS